MNKEFDIKFPLDEHHYNLKTDIRVSFRPEEGEQQEDLSIWMTADGDIKKDEILWLALNKHQATILVKAIKIHFGL